MEEILKQLVYENGLQTLLKRMECVLSQKDLRALTNNVIVSATIVDMDAVVRKIKETWKIFIIKDVKVNLKSQSVSFKIYGSCYVPKKYSSFIVMDWSPVQTEECDYLKEIKENYAEEKTLPLTQFINNGIEVEIVLFTSKPIIEEIIGLEHSFYNTFKTNKNGKDRINKQNFKPSKGSVQGIRQSTL